MQRRNANPLLQPSKNWLESASMWAALRPRRKSPSSRCSSLAHQPQKVASIIYTAATQPSGGTKDG